MTLMHFIVPAAIVFTPLLLIHIVTMFLDDDDY